jgi:thiamine biosynthesis lipoprotein
VELLVDGAPELVAHGFARLRALEDAWSRFRPASEHNRLHDRPGRWVSVSADLFSALAWSARLHTETNGLFDPTIRTALERWGYDTTFSDIDARDRPAPRAEMAPGLDGLELDVDRRAARLASGTRLDLGGIGKGLAADLIAGEIVASGAAGAYVCLGGDIHAAGEPRDGGWTVPLLHPVTREPFAHHLLESGGLVMSTTAIRRWTCGGRDAHHLIDPRTGRPTSTDLVAVAVASRSAARGEALAKSAIVAGSAAGVSMLSSAQVTAWLLGHDGSVRVVEAS